MSISILNRGASGGMKPELTVNAPSGSTIDLLQNGIIIDTYTLGASETKHTFVVKVGTYTVRGTLGAQTKGVDVVVDTIGQYEVEIYYGFYLIRNGEPVDCSLLYNTYTIGGWGVGGTVNLVGDVLVLKNNSNCFHVLAINKLIDFSKYSKLFFFGYENGMGLQINGMSSLSGTWSPTIDFQYKANLGTSAPTLYEYDISGELRSAYLTFTIGQDSVCTLGIKNVWLE